MRSRSQDQRACVVIEGEQPLLGERGNELNREERIAAGLLVHQLRQRRGALRLAVKRVRDELAHIVQRERRKHDLLHASLRRCGSPRASRISGCDGTDLVVAVGADQQQVPHIRLGDQMLEQVERRRVEPLQIVEEQRERMLRPGEHAEEAPEHQLEAALRVLRRQLGDRRLLADDELQARGRGRP